jgi:hypothetical protein
MGAGDRGFGVEMKSGATLAGDFFRPLLELRERVAAELPHIEFVPRLVYGGDRRETRSGVEVVPWSEIQSMDW